MKIGDEVFYRTQPDGPAVQCKVIHIHSKKEIATLEITLSGCKLKAPFKDIIIYPKHSNEYIRKMINTNGSKVIDILQPRHFKDLHTEKLWADTYSSYMALVNYLNRQIQKIQTHRKAT